MSLIADGLLIAGALAAAFYCWILSARVKSLKDLDKGLGAAISALSGKVDDMQTALKATQEVTGQSHSGMASMTDRAERAAEELTFLLERVEAGERQAQRREKPEKAAPKPPAAKPAETAESPLRRALDGQGAPKLRRTTPPARSNAALTNAEALQREIKDKLADRDQNVEAEDIVNTIQSLLVAARQ